MVRTIFCANEQVETVHELSAEMNGEIVATCATCGRFLKFASNTTPEQFTGLVEEQKNANEGQVTVESIEKKLEAFTDPVVEQPAETPVAEADATV